VTGFELATLCSQSRCSTRLSYTPTDLSSLAGSLPIATECDGLRQKLYKNYRVKSTQCVRPLVRIVPAELPRCSGPNGRARLRVSHTTILRWVVHYIPEFEKRWNRWSRRVHSSWRVDETYIRVHAKWYYLYRAVDNHGKTVGTGELGRCLRPVPQETVADVRASVSPVHDLKPPHPRMRPHPDAAEAEVVTGTRVVIAVEHVIHRPTNAEAAEIDAGIQLRDGE
jgi:hypothetical protein